MHLDKFIAAVDAQLVTAPRDQRRIAEAELLNEIGSHFPPLESSKSLAAVRRLIHDLAVRHLCDGRPWQPYRNVAQALQLALQAHAKSGAIRPDWNAATRAAVRYHLHFPPMLPDQQELAMNVGAQVVSKAVFGLREAGYQVLLPDTGGLEMPKTEAARLGTDIDTLCKKLGGRILVASALRGIEPTYSKVTDRFNLGRNGQTVRLEANPQLPLAFLLQLGLKFFHCKATPGVGEAEFSKLLRLLVLAVGVLDLESNDSLGLLFARPTDILETTRKSLLYDATFCLTQAKPQHSLAFVRWLLTHEPFAKLAKDNFSSLNVLAAATFLLVDPESLPTAFRRVSFDAFGSLAGLNLERARRLLTTVFAHARGRVNRKLTFPLQDSEVDSAFRPLLMDDQGALLRLPPNLAARATLNAVIAWCRDAWPKDKGFDEALGLSMERFVRDQFTSRGVKVHFGAYGSGTADGECDLVIQTDSHIVFFELKGKVLTRQSRSGDVLKALEDLADSLARPQAQAMERHAFLKEHGKMELRSDEGRSVIDLGSREVIKVSVTRGELLSLHDRPYLWHYLVAGCHLEFQISDPTQSNALDALHEWFRRFKAAAVRANEFNMALSFPFSRCWSLSLFQLLLLLERTASADDFVRELLRTSKVITPNRDFYVSYEHMLSLDAFRQASANSDRE